MKQDLFESPVSLSNRYNCPGHNRGYILKKGEVKMRIKKSGLEEALKAAD